MCTMNDEVINLKRVAVLITVFNRKDITLQGLKTLYNSILFLGKGFRFDVYMTDDGSTDGTAEAVLNDFPDVHIIHGDGNLYWSGGMRRAWQVAVDSGICYDYYLWFNDDAVLNEYALHSLFIADEELLHKAVVSGAFCDKFGNASYGGRTRDGLIMEPDGTYRDIFLMNGNLVLVPVCVVEKIGMMDSVYRHSLGDWDYGRRVAKAGFRVVLTKIYVGNTDRHDMRIEIPFLSKYSLKKRLKSLYSPKYDPRISWYFNKKHIGLTIALKVLFVEHIYVLIPFMAELRRKMQGK